MTSARPVPIEQQICHHLRIFRGLWKNVCETIELRWTHERRLWFRLFILFYSISVQNIVRWIDMLGSPSPVSAYSSDFRYDRSYGTFDWMFSNKMRTEMAYRLQTINRIVSWNTRSKHFAWFKLYLYVYADVVSDCSHSEISLSILLPHRHTPWCLCGIFSCDSVTIE